MPQTWKNPENCRVAPDGECTSQTRCIHSPRFVVGRLLDGNWAVRFSDGFTLSVVHNEAVATLLVDWLNDDDHFDEAIDVLADGDEVRVQRLIVRACSEACVV